MRNVFWCAVTIAGACVCAGGLQAQERPDRLPSGLELKYGREGLSQREDGTWVGIVRNGNDADNRMGGTNAADVFNGAGGNDLLEGYAGYDRYSFSPGDGMDTINDIHPEGNQILFRGRIMAGDLTVTEEDNDRGFRDRLISYGDGDVVRILNWTGLPDTTHSAWSIEFFAPASEALSDTANAPEDLDDQPDVVGPGNPGGPTNLPMEIIAGLIFMLAAFGLLFKSLRQKA